MKYRIQHEIDFGYLYLSIHFLTMRRKCVWKNVRTANMVRGTKWLVFKKWPLKRCSFPVLDQHRSPYHCEFYCCNQTRALSTSQCVHHLALHMLTKYSSKIIYRLDWMKSFFPYFHIWSGCTLRSVQRHTPPVSAVCAHPVRASSGLVPSSPKRTPFNTLVWMRL